jgi:hypothetical protein
LGGLEAQGSTAGAGLDALGHAQEGLAEGPVEGLALLGAGRVSGAALAEHGEALAFVAERVGVLEAQARGLGVLADVLEHARGLLELAGLLEGQGRAQLGPALGPALAGGLIDVLAELFARSEGLWSPRQGTGW